MQSIPISKAKTIKRTIPTLRPELRTTIKRPMTGTVTPHESDTPSESDALVQLLGQGTFGCTYYPYIDCTGKVDNSAEYISKIQRKSTFDREFAIGKRVQTIDHFSRFFAPVLSGCEVNPVEFQELTDATECAFLKKEAEHPKGEPIITSKLTYIIGESLHNYAHRIVNAPGIPPSEVYQELARLVFIIAYATERLREIQVVHYDIKLENIMYDSIRKCPIIIDFGLSFYGPDVVGSAIKDYLYTKEYYPFWPIESYLASNMARDNIKSKADWDKCVDIFMTNTQTTFGDALALHPRRATIEQMQIAFGQSFKDMYETIKLPDLVQTMYAWDKYGIAMSFVRLLPALYGYDPVVDWAEHLLRFLLMPASQSLTVSLTPIST